jgi:hypothetical protein
MTTPTDPTGPTGLIKGYFDLAVLPDRDDYFAQFTDDAVVEDEGHEHQGISAIRAWRTSVPLVTYSVKTIDKTATGYVSRVNIAGDFPGSPVDLTFTFTFADDDRIAFLTVRP